MSCTPALAAGGLLSDALRLATSPNPKKTEPPPPPPLTPVPSLDGAEYSDAQAVQCLTAACGEFNDNWSDSQSMASRMQTSPKFQTVFNRVLAPAMRGAIAAEQENRLKTLERVQTLLKSGQAAPKNHPAQAVLQMVRLTKKFFANMGDLIDRAAPMGVVRFDEERVKALIASIAVPAEQEVARLLARMLERNLQLGIVDPSVNKLEWRLKRLFPSLDRASALKADATRHLSLLATLETQAGEFFASLTLSTYESAIFRRAASGRDLNNVESKIYLEAASSLETIVAATTGELYQALIKIPFDAEQELAALKSGALEKAITAVKGTDLNQRAESAEGSCRLLLSLAYNSTLSREQLSALESSIHSVRNAAKVVAKRFANSNIGDAGVERLFDQYIAFKLPENPRDSVTEVHLRMRKEMARTKAFTAKIVGGSPDIDAALLIFGPALVTGELGQQDAAASVIGLCHQLPIPALTDATLTAQGKIMLSWYTANYPDVGRGIIAHEIGHVMSKVFRSFEISRPGQARGFMDSLNCVANRNPFVMTPIALAAAQDTPWSEEDWADHFGALVLNEMQKSEPRIPMKSFACALVSGDKSYSGNQLLPAPGDPHSSGFLRVLMVASDRGELPPQCQAFTSYAAANRRPLLCQ